MLSKLSGAYLCAFVWSASQFVRGAKAPKEKWPGYIGDVIWLFTFFSYISSILIFVIPFSKYFPSIIFGMSKGGQWFVFVIHYSALLFLHYYFIRVRVGYAFICEKFSDEEYLVKGRKNFLWMAACIFFPSLLLAVVMIFIGVQNH